MIFTGGLLIGGLSGYLVGMFSWKEHYQKIYEAFADAEIKDMKDYYDRKLKELNDGKDPYVGLHSEVKEESKEEPIASESYTSLVKPYQTSSARVKTDYQGIAKLSKETEEALAEKESPSDDDNGPKEIGELEFGNHSGYEEVTVYCYADKKNNYKNIVLVEEQHSNPIELIDLGRENVLRAVHDDVTDVHYIRNAKLGIDYYLITDDRSYEDVGDQEEYGSDYTPDGHWEKDDDDSWNV